MPVLRRSYVAIGGMVPVQQAELLAAENARLREALSEIATFAGHRDEIPHRLGQRALEALDDAR